MASFQPFKTRFLRELVRWISCYKMQGPFLDFGAGRGDVSEFLRKQTGWNALLVELDANARETLLTRWEGESGCRVVASLIEEAPACYGTAVALDVIEHLEDPDAALSQIARALRLGGHAIATIPYRPSEWDWDDEFYGHIQRMSRTQIIEMFERNGFRILQTVDPSFPLYSLLRRLQLTFRKPPKIAEDPLSRTLVSSRSFAFEMGPITRAAVALFPWSLYDRVSQLLFERVFLGCELLVVAERVATPDV